MKAKQRANVLMVLLAIFVLALSACTTEATEAPTEPTEAAEATAPEPTEAMEEPTEEAIAEGPLYGGTFVMPRSPDLATCNPTISSDVVVSGVLGNIFDGLIRADGSGVMQPQLAETWEVSDDGLTITFNLRDDVFWHDGEKFTSADVKFSYEEGISKSHPRGRVAFGSLERVETPDDYTAIFIMGEPFAAALTQAGAPEGLIIPKHIYENEDLVEGPYATCQELPIGTGPFIADKYLPGERFEMVRNDNWWGTGNNLWDGPYLDRIVVPIIPDATARVNCLESGDCDYVGMLMFPVNEVQRFKELEGFDVLTECTVQALGVMNIYMFNNRREIMNDPLVRQAIAWAIDDAEINERVFYGTGIETSQFSGPQSPWYSTDAPDYRQQDLDKANELLDQAGYPRGDDGVRFEVTLTHDTRTTHTDLTNILQQYLDEIGIEASIESLDFSAFTQKVYKEHDFDIATIILGVADPSVGVSRLYRSDNIGEFNFNNGAAYVNEEIDALWAEFAAEFDFDKRREIMVELQEIMLTDLPYIFVMETTYPAGVNTRDFAGYHQNCGKGDDLLRTVWWREGTSEP